MTMQLPIRAMQLVAVNTFWDVDVCGCDIESESRRRCDSDSVVDYCRFVQLEVPCVLKQLKPSEVWSNASDHDTMSPRSSLAPLDEVDSDVASRCSDPVLGLDGDELAAEVRPNVGMPPGTWNVCMMAPVMVPMCQSPMDGMDSTAASQVAVALQARKLAMGSTVAQLSSAALHAAHKAKVAERRPKRVKGEGHKA